MNKQELIDSIAADSGLSKKVVKFSSGSELDGAIQ